MNFVLLSQIWLMSWSFFQIYIFCQFGEIITGEFMKLGNNIYQSDWYTFPSEIQRTLTTLLINTQQPVVIVGFGNIVCTCETYKKVIFFF